jgi:hypothetical protein
MTPWSETEVVVVMLLTNATNMLITMITREMVFWNSESTEFLFCKMFFVENFPSDSLSYLVLIPVYKTRPNTQELFS